MPDVLAVVQVALEGHISRRAATASLAAGQLPQVRFRRRRPMLCSAGHWPSLCFWPPHAVLRWALALTLLLASPCCAPLGTGPHSASGRPMLCSAGHWPSLCFWPAPPGIAPHPAHARRQAPSADTCQARHRPMFPVHPLPPPAGRPDPLDGGAAVPGRRVPGAQWGARRAHRGTPRPGQGGVRRTRPA
jgi:hypothetical protein